MRMKRQLPEKRITKLIENNRDEIQRYNRMLAMNFDIPARDIISMACSSIGISRDEWDAIQSYRIEHEVTVQH
jgi:hypothetical protein